MNFQHLAYWQEKAKSLTIETRLFINGEYCIAADNTTFEIIGPTAQQILAQVTRDKKVDVERAVKAARQTFDNGDQSQASLARRKAVLTRFADLMETHCEELALLETLDTGKPIRHSLRDDIPGAARAIRRYAEALDRVHDRVVPTGGNELTMIVHEPTNAITAVVPRSFPLLLARWKFGPVLATGGNMTLKPSEKSSLTVLRLTGLAKKAGLPDGALDVISSLGHEAGRALALHPGVEVIILTGSTRAGKQLPKDADDSNVKHVWLKADGKSVSIVSVDRPDLRKVVNTTAGGVFYNQGQVYIAETRLLLEESIADELLTLLKVQTQHWQSSDPLDPNTTIGILIDSAYADNVHSFIRGGEAKSTLFLDRRKNPWPVVVGPIIFVDINPASTLSREEAFGPVPVVTCFKSEGQTLQFTNDNDHGFGAAIRTHSLSRTHRASRRLKAGSVFINNYDDGDMTAPLGSYKQSGNGRDKSPHALEKFTELKTIWIALGS